VLRAENGMKMHRSDRRASERTTAISRVVTCQASKGADAIGVGLTVKGDHFFIPYPVCYPIPGSCFEKAWS